MHFTIHIQKLFVALKNVEIGTKLFYIFAVGTCQGSTTNFLCIKHKNLRLKVVHICVCIKPDKAAVKWYFKHF